MSFTRRWGKLLPHHDGINTSLSHTKAGGSHHGFTSCGSCSLSEDLPSLQLSPGVSPPGQHHPSPVVPVCQGEGDTSKALPAPYLDSITLEVFSSLNDSV